jgi:hypothetical protein
MNAVIAASNGGHMPKLSRILLAVGWLTTVPASAYAQATLAGVVKDTSGAVLPGVTVEASSPALIEKTRTAVTDGSGQYQIVDLRPGPYIVTFSLTGFSTIKREEVEVIRTTRSAIGWGTRTSRRHRAIWQRRAQRSNRRGRNSSNIAPVIQPLYKRLNPRLCPPQTNARNSNDN